MDSQLDQGGWGSGAEDEAEELYGSNGSSSGGEVDVLVLASQLKYAFPDDVAALVDLTGESVTPARAGTLATPW